MRKYLAKGSSVSLLAYIWNKELINTDPELIFDEKINRFEMRVKTRKLTASNPYLRNKFYVLVHHKNGSLNLSLISRNLFFMRQYDTGEMEEEAINNTIALMKRRKIGKKATGGKVDSEKNSVGELIRFFRQNTS